jgi:ABC-type multidrug transport system, ATPase and permease components
MSKQKRLLKPGAFKRLFKMLLSFYPVMLPAIIVMIILNAIIGALPSVFMQNITAVIEDATTNNIPWAEAQPRIMHFVILLACFYAAALALSFTYNQLMAFFTQGSLSKIRKTMFEHMESLPIRYFDTDMHAET